MGGSRDNSCSILEAIRIIENLSKIEMNYKINSQNRIGDHQWYISDIEKFKKHYKNFSFKYSLKTIIQEIIECKR